MTFDQIEKEWEFRQEMDRSRNEEILDLDDEEYQRYIEYQKTCGRCKYHRTNKCEDCI